MAGYGRGISIVGDLTCLNVHQGIYWVNRRYGMPNHANFGAIILHTSRQASCIWVPEVKTLYMGFSGISPNQKMRIYSSVVLGTYHRHLMSFVAPGDIAVLQTVNP